MKSLAGLAVIAVILVAAGIGVRRAAILEDDLALAQEQLATTTRVAPEVDERLDDTVALVGNLPVLGPRITREVNRGRAEAAYWQGNYAALAPTAATLATEESDPEVLLLQANASFRTAVRDNRTAPALVRALDPVLKAYAGVLEANPASVSAAYNYEYIVRLRAALSSSRNATLPAPRQQNMQGEEGEPPKGSQQTDFNVIVPLRPEERQEQMDPGTGATFQRKG